ncbi:MAG: hypothetical protein K8R74_08830 [Bacteroidales bacterium]|nr:hypothetical protein [Bacteroidales bacterium]
MKNTALTFILFLLINFCSFSQSDYQPGYVIKTNSDTLIGLINNKSLKKLSKSCIFKETEKSQQQKYNPEDLIGYKFTNGKYYISKKIYSNDNSKYVFLEFLINGKADLFYLKDTDGQHYFIQNENDSLYELLNTNSDIFVNSNRYIRENKEYIGILKNAFRDSREIQSEIDNSSYSHASLIKLTQNYHDYVCDEYACIRYQKNTMRNLAIGLLLGPYYSKIKFNPKAIEYDFLNNETFQESRSYSLAALLTMSKLFGMNENLSLNIATGFRQVSYESENVKINQDNFYIPIYVTYSFPTGAVKPIVNIGLDNIFNLKTSISCEVEDEKGYWDFNELLNNSIGFYQISGLLGLGVELSTKKFNYLLVANYEIGIGINGIGRISNNYLSSKTTSIGISFGLKYNFKN